uniref:SH2 domain containing 4A n=1 Tax=Esox lucius TaxID=8010 RepID=A0AAY5L264_ESOLU
MLQQILTDMFIDPELLAELNEDQKQVLFIKMREEQVRRWKEREARLEKEGATQKTAKKDPAKSVQWLTGLDKDVWVWVMGDHTNDKSYEQICDEIFAQRAAMQAQKEAEELRAKKEVELVKRFSCVLMDPELQLREEEERQERERQEVVKQEQARQAAAEEQSRLEEELKKKEEEERRKAEDEVRRLEQKRKQEIYMDLKEIKEERDDQHWQDSLRKSKAADLRRRSIAKQTREDHRRRSVKALEQGRVAAVARVFGGDDKPVPLPKPRSLTVTSDTLKRKQGVRRTMSTSGREHIIRWFQEEQLPVRAGFEKDQSRIAPWFHGIISRQEAEDLLREEAPGHFLMRVSERILGYVLSYRSEDSFRHFLVDATGGCYMLLGHQIRFGSLAELVEYHEVVAHAGLLFWGGLVVVCGPVGGARCLPHTGVVVVTARCSG